MFLVNSRLGLFSAAFFRRHPFSLSYGVILPSSLTTVLWLALGYSPHPPVSVCGTGTFNLDRDFSRQCEISYFATKFRSASYPSIIWTGFAYPNCLNTCPHITNSAVSLSFCVIPFLKRLLVVQEYQPVVHHLRLSASA